MNDDEKVNDNDEKPSKVDTILTDGEKVNDDDEKPVQPPLMPASFSGGMHNCVFNFYATK